MNAKKIMGAVLVALLAAALFIGAGAAADDGKDFGTVFIYQANTTLPEGVWTLVGGTATVTTVDNDTTGAQPAGTNVMPGADFVAGTYKLGDDTVTFVKPTASYALSAKTNETNVPYIVANGGNVYLDSKLEWSINALNKTSGFIEGYYVTYPDGFTFKNTTVPTNVTEHKGAVKVQALFNVNKFVAGVPEGLLVDENNFTFNVVGSEDATISASVDTAYDTEFVTITVAGTPGAKYNVTLIGFDLPSPSSGLQAFNVNTTAKDVYFTIGNSGKFTFKAAINSSKLTAADEEDTAVIQLRESGNYDTVLKDGEIEIKIAAPVVTATLGASSYFIGDVIKISGTSTADSEFEFTISGTNFPETKLNKTNDSDDNKKGKEWKAALKTDDVKHNGKKLDVGTYTIKIYMGTYSATAEPVKTVAVALKQPFISIVEAPEVIVQGTEAKFIINAEAVKAATPVIQAYFFGTNYFEQKPGKLADSDITNEFTVTLSKTETNETNMAAGQYFAVFQHPMYDGMFNILAFNNAFYLNTTTQATQQSQFLFSVDERQTANAAQALCDALDTQNIDDMYVKYSFFVVGEDESFTISEIPTTVAQGETLTISGVSTAAAGKTVQVEMLSTAFAAVPKETVGSAAFILVTTEVADDGTWEVTLDTSDLNVDEYSLKVACGDDTWKNVKINVVEGAETPDTPDVPDTPDTPDTPTEPETPGFGALAALAGLGAVAVLLLRRE